MAGPTPRKPFRNLRWLIIAVSFSATAVNYLDRQALSVAAPTISREFHFSNADYSTIVNSFLAPYMIMQFLSGAIVDRIGVRRGMALFLSWWSAAGALHSLASGLGTFRLFRFLLGMGEAGNWPASTKAVSEWFPARERSLAVAIFDSGSSLGGLLAPPLVAWLIATRGWRAPFLVTGALGLVVLLAWLVIYRQPDEHPRLSPSEREWIVKGQVAEARRRGPKMGWQGALRRSAVWGVIAGRFCSDCVWWFYVYWLPKYLADRWGFGLTEIAMVAWIPFVAVDLGNLAGGWFSGHLMWRGWSLDASRKCLLRIGAVGMLAGAPAGLSGHAGLSMAFIAMATFAYGIWGTMMLTLPADLFHPSDVGVVSGLSGTGAGLGGIAFTWLTGAVVDRMSYQPIFAGAALLPLLSLVLVQLLIPQIRYLASDTSPKAAAS